MIVTLYSPGETVFAPTGIELPDAVSCTVREDTEGKSELTMKYPMEGANFQSIGQRCLLLAKPDPYTSPQPFRIYSISRPTNGLVTFRARHLAYDTAGIPLKPFSAVNEKQAAAMMKAGAVEGVSNPFTLSTPSNWGFASMAYDEPISLREASVTAPDSRLHTYKGGISYDKFTITLNPTPGQNRGIVIRYGVDLIDVQQEENIGEMFTGIVPYWKGNVTTTVDGQTVQTETCITGSVINASGSFPVSRIMAADLSEYFETAPTVAQLNTLGQTYITSKGIGIPTVSLKLSYADIGQDVRLYDTISVSFPLLGVTTQAAISATTYDVLKEIITTVEVGEIRPTITDTLKDASRLTAGTLPTQRIQDHSIGGGKMSTGGVSARALAAYAVTKGKLDALAVGTENIENGAVTQGKLSLEVNELIANAIQAGSLAANTISFRDGSGYIIEVFQANVGFLFFPSWNMDFSPTMVEINGEPMYVLAHTL